MAFGSHGIQQSWHHGSLAHHAPLSAGEPMLDSVCLACAQIYRALAATILYTCMPYGPVAQGIEQQPSKLKVAGSNPAGVASKINSFCVYRAAQIFPEPLKSS
jgi:hypothetical protein